MPDLTRSEPGWFCFKALPKKEHIAAELIRRDLRLDTLSPRITYPKKTRRGKVNFTEPLFPGYVFVWTDLVKHYRQIRSIQGIRDVVAFGPRLPRLPDGFIEDLKARLDEENRKVIPDPVLRPGQTVTITEGPFKDWEAIISGELDGRQRVGLLLDFLGRQMEIKVRASDVLLDREQPGRKVWEA